MRIFFEPGGEAFGDFFADISGEVLEKGAAGAAAAGAGSDFWFEVAEAEGLEEFFADFDFAGARGVFVGGDGDANGVADAFVKENCEGGAGGDEALESAAGFGEAEVERVAALGFARE